MIRTVLALARRDVKPMTSTALISITAPEDTLPAWKWWTHVLRLVVSDLDRWPGDSYRSVYGEPLLFSAWHAEAIWSFVRGLPNDVATLLVHCDAGISRSPAVATVIADELGADLQVSRLAQPNKLIMDALRGAI